MYKYNGLLEYMCGRITLEQKRKGFNRVVYAIFDVIFELLWTTIQLVYGQLDGLIMYIWCIPG